MIHQMIQIPSLLTDFFVSFYTLLICDNLTDKHLLSRQSLCKLKQFQFDLKSSILIFPLGYRLRFRVVSTSKQTLKDLWRIYYQK